MLKLATKLVMAFSAAVALGVLGAPAAGAATAEGHSDHGAPVQESAPMAWSYTIMPSCGGWEGPIRQGANYWGDVTEGGGTPVECQNSAITDCGFEPVEVLVDGQLIVVGCNYGMGQLIKLFPGAVSDAALLAAHEFGHNWYGHSYQGCASWASPEAVMATTMC
ncbi:MAG TPA: hypothetical protein VHH15_01335 [Actinophytocola sp.]|nr:hypothetical protein [Actinophytocola sp.]